MKLPLPFLNQEVPGTIAFIMFISLVSCEDVISLELEEAPQQIVVDAWINNLEETQFIELTWSQPYFDQNEPKGITHAGVTVRRDDGKSFTFNHDGKGRYSWTPSGDGSLGYPGDAFTLEILMEGAELSSSTVMTRVPSIDSIGFEYRENEIFQEDGIYAQFYARDFLGKGDTYWIKTFKNGQYLAKSQELNLAYDAGFDAGTGIDGLVFIPPIRELVNALDEDLIAQPYVPGDTIVVEIHSLSEGAFQFMEIARDQINNGDNGIFSLPLANTRTNISISGPAENTPVLGYFNVAAVSRLQKVVP